MEQSVEKDHHMNGGTREQTLLMLTPFTTTAPVAGGNLADYLQESSPYRPFAEHLQRFSRSIGPTYMWGGIVPALDVLGGKLEKDYNPIYRNQKTWKLLTSISHPMVEYISAFKFYDILARIECSEGSSRDVLKQPQRKGYIGDQKHMSGISNLRILVDDVLKAGEAYTHVASSHNSQQTSSSSSQEVAPHPVQSGVGAPDPLLSIAQELNDAAGTKGALKIIRNVSAVALSVRVLMQGTCLSVPDDHDRLIQQLPLHSRPQNTAQTAALATAMSNPRGLRQAFYLAALISPLLSVAKGKELQKYSVCLEETLVNSKRIGNDKPDAITRLEDQVWTEVLRVAEGSQTSVTAFLNLYRSWKQSKPEFTLEENGFFDRPQSMEKSKITQDVSIFETTACGPYPEGWPLSNEGWAHVRQAPDGADAQGSSENENTSNNSANSSNAHANSASNDNGDNAEKGGGREDDDNEGHGPEDGGKSRSPAPEYNEDKEGDEDDGENEDNGGNGGNEDIEANEGNEDGGESGGPGPDAMEVVPQSPRRSVRERKGPPANPTRPERVVGKAKGAKPSRKRRRDSIDKAERDTTSDIVFDIRQVHGKGLRKRQEILEESLVKMEGVEPRLVSEVEEGTLPLNVDEAVTRYSDQETYMFDAWDAEGTKESLRLESHLESDFSCWKTILEAIKAQHCPSGRPRFLDDPDQSVLRVFPKANYTPRLADLVQQAFGKQCLIIPRFEAREAASSFDLEGLEEVCDVNHKTAVQDFSTPESSDLNDRVRLGSLKDVYTSSVASDDKRKSLNALYFPQPNERIDPKDPISSDSRAWFRTKSEPHCLTQLPTVDMRWHIVGTTGASHYFHVDPRGDGTFILVRVGLKAWVLATPTDESVLFSAELWTKLEQDITKFDFAKWKIEMVLLRPGDLLLQWPHVSHAVYTPLHAICKGGHFIAVSTLRRTLFGMIHTFFCTGITNIDHPTFTGRINSLVCFFYKALTAEAPSQADSAHLPDILSVSGLIDVLLLACVVEVQNALCPLSYAITDDQALLALLDSHDHTPISALNDFDISSMPHDMRVQNVYSRGRMQVLLRHIFKHKVTISRQDGTEMRDPWGQLFIPMLAWLINSLKTYLKLSLGTIRKQSLGKKRIRDQVQSQSTPIADGGTNFKALFNVQMRSSALRWEPLADMIKKIAQDNKAKEITSFLSPDIDTSITVTEKRLASDTQPALKGPEFPVNFRELGARTLDSIYFAKYAQLVDFDATLEDT